MNQEFCSHCREIVIWDRTNRLLNGLDFNVDQELEVVSDPTTATRHYSIRFPQENENRKDFEAVPICEIVFVDDLKTSVSIQKWLREEQFGEQNRTLGIE